MNDKPKPAPRPAPKIPDGKPPRKTFASPPQKPDARWQRTVRYGWDKGGSKGGR